MHLSCEETAPWLAPCAPSGASSAGAGMAPWLALGPQLLWFSWPRLDGVFGLPSIALSALATFLAGLAIPWIVRTFHVHSGTAVTIVVWHAALIGVPLLIGALHRPTDGGSRWSFGARSRVTPSLRALRCALAATSRGGPCLWRWREEGRSESSNEKHKRPGA